MNRRDFIQGTLVSAALASLARISYAQSDNKVDVIFVSPGKHSEDFFATVSDSMKVAAQAPGVNLTIVHGQRNRVKTINDGTKAIQEAPPSSYVIVINEQKTAAPLAKAALDRGQKLLIAFNPLLSNDAEDAVFGLPREKYPNYIGTLIPDNVQAGRLIAEALVSAAPGGDDWGVIALNGLSATPAAADRLTGLKQALASKPAFPLLQTVDTDWSEEDSAKRAQGLLTRYQSHKRLLLWCANDPIALGALRAAREMGRIPGKDILVAGLNWSDRAFAGIQAGDMVASVGGHVFAGAAALAMIADHAAGLDFLAANLQQSMPFGTIDATVLAGLTRRFGATKIDLAKIDYATLSRKTSGAAAYDFNPARLVG